MDFDEERMESLIMKSQTAFKQIEWMYNIAEMYVDGCDIEIMVTLSYPLKFVCRISGFILRFLI